MWDDLSVLSSEIHGIKGYGLFFGGGDYYRPFLALAHGLDYAIWYTNPLGFHLTNILLNALCGIAAYFVFLHFFQGKNNLLPFMAALLFVLHPAHADSVAWIAGRTDIIATLFFLLALLAYVLYREENDRRTLFLCALFFLFSLFGKEVGITFPLIALSYDALIKQRKAKDIFTSQVPLWIVVIIYFLLRKIPQPPVGITGAISGGNVGTSINLLGFIKEIAFSFGFYIEKLLLPFHLSMFPDIHRAENIFFIAVFFLIFFIAVTKKSRTITFGMLFIVLTILPSLPVALMKNVPAPVAIRYLYLPVFGFSLIIASSLDKIRPKYIKIFVFCVVFMIYGISGSLRNMNWKDNLALWGHEVIVNKDSAVAHGLLGHSLYEAKKYDRAEKEMLYVIAHFDSLRKNKSIGYKLKGDCLNTLGLISFERKELNIAKLYLGEALKYSKNNRSVYHNLGTVYLALYYDKKDNALLKEANAMYMHASEIDPNYINSKYGAAFTAQLLGQREEALKYYEGVINIDPRSSLALRAAKGIASIQNQRK